MVHLRDADLLYLLAAGNLRHLIVEACIARNLLDTSAYFWPGYVNGRSNQLPRSVPGPISGWSSLMKGSLLTPPMINVLVSTPASRYAGSPFSLFTYCLSVGMRDLVSYFTLGYV